MVDIDGLIVRGPLVTPLQPVYISEKGEIVEWPNSPLANFALFCSGPRTNGKGMAKATFRRCQRTSVPRLPQKSGAVPGVCADWETRQSTTSRRCF